MTAEYARELKPSLNQLTLQPKIYDSVIKFVDDEITDSANHYVDLYFVDYDKLTAYLEPKGFQIKQLYQVSW